MNEYSFETYEVDFLGKKLLFVDFGVVSAIQAYSICNILCDNQQEADNLFRSIKGSNLDKNNLCLEETTAIKLIRESEYENKDSLIETIKEAIKWFKDNWEKTLDKEQFIADVLVKEKIKQREKFANVRNVLSYKI